MKQHGLLEGAEQTTYIEYGAGKGYLWCAALLTLCRLLCSGAALLHPYIRAALRAWHGAGKAYLDAPRMLHCHL